MDWGARGDTGRTGCPPPVPARCRRGAGTPGSPDPPSPPSPQFRALPGTGGGVVVVEDVGSSANHRAPHPPPHPALPGSAHGPTPAGSPLGFGASVGRHRSGWDPPGSPPPGAATVTLRRVSVAEEGGFPPSRGGGGIPPPTPKISPWDVWAPPPLVNEPPHEFPKKAPN